MLYRPGPFARVAAGLALGLTATLANAAIIDFVGVYRIDTKTTLDPNDGPSYLGTQYDQVQLGDRFNVHFSIDSDALDTDNSVDTTPNPALNPRSQRQGAFGPLLTSLNITPLAGNTGTFDPSAIGYNTAQSVSFTNDTSGVWTSSGNIATSESVQLRTAVTPSPSVLGGDLLELALNFYNVAGFGITNLDDFLDDDSATVSPFSFDQLLTGNGNGGLGAGCVYCDARDLVLLNDDIINAAGISFDESNRPLALDFGQAVLTNQPGAPTVTLWATGTFENLSVVPLPATAWLLLAGFAGIGAARARHRAGGPMPAAARHAPHA